MSKPARSFVALASATRCAIPRARPSSARLALKDFASLGIGSLGPCYDNARMESLNGIIKTEALYCAFGKSKVNGRRIPQAQVLERVLQFIGYYNSERPKMGLGMMSPVQFRLRNPNGSAAYGFGWSLLKKALDKIGNRNDHVLEIKTLPSLEAVARGVLP